MEKINLKKNLLKKVFINRPRAGDRLFYLIYIKSFNHIVGMCRELVLRNAFQIGQNWALRGQKVKPILRLEIFNLPHFYH